MEMSTQTKSFLLLLLTPCLAFFICQLPSYLSAFSQSWEEVLPAPPANSVMIAGASQRGGPPNVVRTKDGKYYQLIGSSGNNQKWSLVKNVDINESYRNLLESEYKASNPLIPFLFNRPPGTVIDHFYTSRFGLYNGGSSRYKVYYVLLDGGTLWSWSDPRSVDEPGLFQIFGIVYAIIVFGVTGVMLLVMNRVGKFLGLEQQNPLKLMFLSIFISFILSAFFLLFLG